MAVNQTIYGDKTTWSGDNFKYANFGNNTTTLNAGFTNGRLTPNKPLNTSVVHSAIGTESVIAHLHYYGNLEEYATDNFEVLQYTFASGGDDISNRRSTLNVTTTTVTEHDGMITPKTKTGTGLNNVSPVIDFDYKRLRALIKVHVSANKSDYKSGTVKEYTLKEYIDSHTAEYPYIRDVILDLYNVENGVASEINGVSAKGIIIYNSVSLYKAFKRTATSYYGKCHTGLMYCCYNNLSTRNFNKIIIYGLLNYDPDATSHIYHVAKQYVGVFSDDVTIESDGTYTYCYREYSSDFEEFIKRQTACFGIQFVTDTEYLTIDLESDETTEEEAENVYIGVLDEACVGHGDYINGKAILDNKQYQLDSADESDYVSLEPEDDIGDLESMTHNIGGTLAGITTYNMTAANLDLLIKWLNSEESGETGQNYAQYIMSIKYSAFGFEPRSTSDETIKIGGHLVNVGTTAVEGRRGFRLNGWTTDAYPIERYWNDFRDFEPYTTIALKLPFGDTIQLNCGEWYGHNLTIKYSTDTISGSGIAMIYRDNLQWMSVNLTTYTDIPLSALNAGSYHNALIQAKVTRNSALIGIGASALSVGASISSGNVVGAAASGAGLLTAIERYKQSDYSLNHMTKSISRIGSSGDIADFKYEWRPNIIFERRRALTYDKTVYKNTVGYACLKTGKLSQFSGLTVCSDVKLSDFGATAEEKIMIKEALSKGVYL